MWIAAVWHAGWTGALVNHLWQSTVVAGIAWLLALALRKNHARTRYWLWMVASAKFLLPFSFVIAGGEWVRPLFAAPPAAQPAIVAAMQEITQPFPQEGYFDAATTSTTVHQSGVLIAVLLAVWACGVVVVAGRWFRGWWRLRAAARSASPMEFAADVPVLMTAAPIEPGVLGIVRPILLLPKGIQTRLTPAQCNAVIAHEMCHVRRRDNLTFAVHMAVEALFWFHPAVWWIGARLIDEREQACDEAVVLAGGEAATYAEGILKVCGYCIESPLACAAGVTGSDLKRRIVRIMSESVARKLDLNRKLLLATAASLVVVVPLTLGVVRSAQMRAQDAPEAPTSQLPSFEVASIKPHKNTDVRMMISVRFTPDGAEVTGMPLLLILRQTFGVSSDRILNEPDWAKSARYDIVAKVDAADVSKLEKLDNAQRWAMMLPLLENRFGLKFHKETKDERVYTLVVAKGGPKLQESNPGPDGKTVKQPAPPAQAKAGGAMIGRVMIRMSTKKMTMEAHGASVDDLIHMLALQLGSTVVDKTGLKGNYDYTLIWAPDPGMMRGPGGLEMEPPSGDSGAGAEPTGPSLFTALQEQLGLKLETRKEPVDVFVVDQIERPSPN